MSRSPALYDLTIYDPAKDPFAVPRNNAQVDQILATVPNKNDQIDAICEARGWKEVSTKLRDTLDAYLDGNMSTDEILELLAAPIEASYSTADHGYLL